jgi:hypothetical protein
MSPVKIGHVNHSVFSINDNNLINKTFTDGSNQYCEYFDKMLSEEMIKAILSGFIRDNSPYI